MSELSTADIQARIAAAFPGDAVHVTGQGCHLQAQVTSARFDGLRAVQRHRLVYDSLGDLMQEAIHALRIQALTPNEANQ